MKKTIITSILAGALSLSNVASADSAFLALVGAKSGQIQGAVTQKGREGKIEIFAVEHSITGAATGRRQHGAFVITKPVDKSSPALYRVLTTNEPISSFELQFFQPTMGGVEKMIYSVKLSNARIVDIKFHQANNKVPSQMRLDDTEEVSFTYEKITWTWSDGNVSASDSSVLP